jgi:uncharacterized membrane protein YkgB
MTTLMQDTAHEKGAMSSQVGAVGRELARYGLVVVVAWIGLMKFTEYEAEGISIAILIAARPFSPRASAVGSALAVGMFLTTLSFLLTTPGVWAAEGGGFPALSGFPGQFLIKDLALLGISLWSFGEAWKAN